MPIFTAAEASTGRAKASVRKNLETFCSHECKDQELCDVVKIKLVLQGDRAQSRNCLLSNGPRVMLQLFSGQPYPAVTEPPKAMTCSGGAESSSIFLFSIRRMCWIAFGSDGWILDRFIRGIVENLRLSLSQLVKSALDLRFPSAVFLH
jgi:hypothetical protein